MKSYRSRISARGFRGGIEYIFLSEITIKCVYIFQLCFFSGSDISKNLIGLFFLPKEYN